MGDGGRGEVHRRGVFHGGEVGDELAGCFGIALAIFSPAAGEADDRRIFGEGVEKAVGREVDAAFGVNGGDPPDWARGDDRLEGIMGKAMALGRFVEVEVGHGVYRGYSKEE